MVCWTKKGTKRRKVKEKKGMARGQGRRGGEGQWGKRKKGGVGIKGTKPAKKSKGWRRKGKNTHRKREREGREGTSKGEAAKANAAPCSWYVGETSRKNRNCKMCNCEFCPRLDEREDCRRRQRKVHPNRLFHPFSTRGSRPSLSSKRLGGRRPILILVHRFREDATFRRAGIVEENFRPRG